MISLVKTNKNNSLKFNSAFSNIMHIDLNSCFATIEQQANPHLRGKPIAVAAYTTPNGCILAPSVEAKRCGVKTGMRVRDGQALCPNLIVMGSDPWKYRNVHLKLRDLIANYTDDFYPKSIDEFVLNLSGTPCLQRLKVVAQSSCTSLIHNVAREIKQRIKKEIGEWLTVSVGISTNRFLAKLASGLHKPDGLDEINSQNFRKIYDSLSLTDLPYIKARNAARLAAMKIYRVIDFYQAPLWKLKAAFQSVVGYYWHVRLHGWEVDDIDFARRSYGNSYALPKPLRTTDELSPILTKLVEKMGARLRRAGYKARGVHLSILYRDWSHWHKGVSFPEALFDSRDIYKKAFKIMLMAPHLKPVRELAVSTFSLTKSNQSQLQLFEDVIKNESLVKSIDIVNERWGNFVITPARMLMAERDAIPDRVAFGGVKELEEFVNSV
jgi:DNA polymerase-4